jgi:hypothetical protein
VKGKTEGEQDDGKAKRHDTKLLQSSGVEMKKPQTLAGMGFLNERSWRRPTLPHQFRCSTIGAAGLNDSVRNGKRCVPRAIITKKYVNVVETTKMDRAMLRACVLWEDGWLMASQTDN